MGCSLRSGSKNRAYFADGGTVKTILKFETFRMNFTAVANYPFFVYEMKDLAKA